jgi:hypothetical protein
VGDIVTYSPTGQEVAVHYNNEYNDIAIGAFHQSKLSHAVIYPQKFKNSPIIIF